MASVFFGLNRGQDTLISKVTNGAASGSTDVELRIDTGKNLTRKEVEALTQVILAYVLGGLNAQKFPNL